MNRRFVPIAGALLLVFSGVAFWLSRAPSAPLREGGAPVAASSGAAATSAPRVASSAARGAPSGSVSDVAAAPRFGTDEAGGHASTGARAGLSLGSARQTVSTQVQLLREGSDDAFRATFTPEVRAELTREAIESCRKRMGSRGVTPDWEVAEQNVEPDDAGKPHRVLRVSMWGKSLTGFHEVEPGVWLADAAWCVPIW